MAVWLQFAFLMTGVCNTLFAQLANSMETECLDRKIRRFSHPFLMVWVMYLIGSTVYFLYHFERVRRIFIRKQMKEDAFYKGVAPAPSMPDEILDMKPFNHLIFLPPAMMSMLATCLSFLGLNLTYAASHQTLRGSLVVFTALFSRCFLGHKIGWIRFLGILLLLSGMLTVGFTDLSYSRPYISYFSKEINPADVDQSHNFYDVFLGDVLILIAQVIAAIQMVYEEKFLTKFEVPAMLAVGLENLFCLHAMTLLLIPMYFIHVGETFRFNSKFVLEDSLDGLHQILLNNSLAGVLTVFGTSVAFYLCFGMQITKTCTATSRTVLDSIRIIIVWSISVIAGWQEFHAFHIFGFVLFFLGLFIYNQIFFVPMLRQLWWMLIIKRCDCTDTQLCYYHEFVNSVKRVCHCNRPKLNQPREDQVWMSHIEGLSRAG